MISDKKNRDKRGADPTASQNRINEGTTLTGDIVSSGFFRVDGTIKGNISKPSKVVLGVKGVMEGTLQCEQADIEGTFDGKLLVTGLLTLRASANITGEVIVGKLSVEPGATFNASCEMGTGVKSIHNESSKKGEKSA